MTDRHCPDESDLLVLLDDDASAGTIAQHVADCPRCQQLLARMKKGIGTLQSLISDSRTQVSPPAARTSQHAQTVPLFFDKYFVAGIAQSEPGLTVYRAAHALLKSELFLFFLQRPIDPDSSLGELLVQQAKRVAEIEHPALPRVHDLGFFEKFPYLVTDAVEGRDLNRFLAEAMPPAAEAVRIVVELARALAAIHEQRIAHGHVCSNWVLIDRDNHPHLLGTGVALLAQTAAAGGDSSAAGGIGFDSAELTDAPRDVLALGSLLHLLLTGREAAAGERLEKGEIPASLVRPLECALAADPSQRPTAAEWAASLERADASRRITRLALYVGAIILVAGIAFSLALAR